MSPAAARRSVAVDIGLLALLVLGLVGVVTVVVVQRVLLEPDTYGSALVEADAFERIYTEILADPELADLAEDLLGGLDVDPGLAVDARVLSINALRRSVPPSTLQQGSDALIHAVLAHIRGDARVLDADIDVGPVLDRIPTSAATEARTLLAHAAGRPAASIEELRASIEAFAGALAAGEVPAQVPELGTDAVPADEVVEAILDGFGLAADDALRAQVTASVLAGAERDLLITLGGAEVRDQATDVADDLRRRASGGRELDVVDALRGPTQRSRDAVVDTLDGTQSLAAWFGPLTGVLAATAVVAAGAGLIATNRGDQRRARRLIALGWGIGGTAVCSGGRSVRSSRSPWTRRRRPRPLAGACRPASGRCSATCAPRSPIRCRRGWSAAAPSSWGSAWCWGCRGVRAGPDRPDGSAGPRPSRSPASGSSSSVGRCS